jgi:hypothetical protein
MTSNVVAVSMLAVVDVAVWAHNILLILSLYR